MAALKEVFCTSGRLQTKLPIFKQQILRRILKYSKVVVCKRDNGSYTSTPFPEFAGVSTIKTHEDLYKFSLENPDVFWGKLARSRLKWTHDFHLVKDCNMSDGKIRWFEGGKLNASENCIDRHLETKRNQAALIWEKDEPGTQEIITYGELQVMVNQIANMLRHSGVERGDRVAIYLPMSPTAVAAMLACTRIGVVHSVVFAGFSAEALAGRIMDAQAETVITADQAVRGGKIIELKKIVDDAVKKCSCVRQVFVYQRTGGDVPMGKKDITLEKGMESESKICKISEMNSEDVLYMLYTSGSTGKPKGLTHSTAGYLLYANVTFKHAFDYQDGEMFGCVADIGWVTGHSYAVYGPLSNGATTLLFESTPVYPNPGRYWEMVERLKLNHIYLAPTALRLLLKSGDSWVKKYDLSSLRKLGCVGEPLNTEAWEWFYSVVGEERCDIIDTWWQTETGGICLAPRPSSPGAEIKPAMPMRPFFGIEPALMDQNGKELTVNDVQGALCIKRPWPGMTRNVFGDNERYLNTYFKPYPGSYFTGDGAYRTPEGYYQITGRMDDVLNVTGHRLGTAEIEDAITEHPDISEAAVVGFPHEIKGEGVYAYITLKDSVNLPKNVICDQLKLEVRKKIAAYAVPDVIQVTPSLPRTRSGKIMRRILRKIAANKLDELGDISTLSEPEAIQQIIAKHVKLTSEK